ncbi:MAG: hypothetical protein HY072_04195 [Deltaproteobacteria bacterium]|nr:hypothetical protein [Deltaproteobacteria bacterium]
MRSCNTFPQATGIASSAAAFAALTMAVIKLGLFLTKQDQENKLLLDKEFQRFIVKLSRCGSGSSCRSFYGPWVRWGKDSVEPIVSKMPEMVDLVLLVNSAPKKVSSTRAHELVKTSQLWDGRVKRANDRVQKIVQAIQTGDTDTVSQIAWQEMWEMHSLFHTCERPFTYWDGRTIEILKWLECYVNGEKKGSTTLPIVTSDAGANIHVLVPKTEAGAWLELIKNKFSDTVLQDVQGRGVFGF